LLHEACHDESIAALRSGATGAIGSSGGTDGGGLLQIASQRGGRSPPPLGSEEMEQDGVATL